MKATKADLALHGGTPVRAAVLPYGRQHIDEEDIAAVAEVLRSDWLTTGPKIGEFEQAFAQFVGASHAVAVSNGTAALHAALYALDVGAGDEVIVTPMTFAASANAAVYLGATPIFADVEPDTLLLDPATIEAKITPRTKAIVAVDYAGQPCDYDAIYAIARKHGLAVLDDACHAFGGHYKNRPVGTLADVNTFSLHPVKHMTTGEGGVITTESAAMAQAMRVFRNHGITTDHRQRSEQGGFFYEMVSLGYNYRLTDFQAALGLSQLKKLPEWIAKRQAIAHMYDAALADIPAVAPLAVRPEVGHGYHLYMVQFDLAQLTADRAEIFQALRAEGLGVNVHYIPVHLHPFYRQNYGTAVGDCPAAEAAYERLVTLPIFPDMNNGDMEDVVAAVQKVVEAYQR
ncbi:MAG: UDP-4-amino-4,6-dideoxy-N-acetyl-beta-L-altrosamine transaminase [Chloroflexi bacterium]|nr:UDP-4-amino-4,6-dideoxy-N-acetyl-beta-L-altrosamine transaminase [Chloroflexota bacterium]